MTEKLDPQERRTLIDGLSAGGWSEVDGRDAITKTYAFADFVEAFGFMTRAAMHAEKLNHHPEWTNVYRRVEVTLTTHEVDGLSPLDIRLAKHMDALVE